MAHLKQPTSYYNGLGDCIMAVETQNFASLQGECVMTVLANGRSPQQRIDISHLPGGVYYLKTGASATRFVVVR